MNDSIVFDDLSWRDGLALYRLARQPDFFYAYLNERGQPLWLAVMRFIALGYKGRWRGCHVFKAVRTPRGQLIGCVILLNRGKIGVGLAELAYFIATPWQGQGIGSQMVKAVMRWGYEIWGVRGFYAHIDPRNPASLAIAQKVGLTPVKFLDVGVSQFTDRDGKPCPCWILQTTPASLTVALSA